MSRGKTLINKHIPWCYKCLKHTKFRNKKYADEGHVKYSMECKICNCIMYTPEYSESFFLMKGDAPFGIIAFFVLIGFFKP